MDPLSIAAQRFHAQLRMAWEPAPGSGQQAPMALLRLVAEPTYRGQLVKALRLVEWDLQNRRPYVIVEAEPTPMAICQQLVEDFATLRRALRDDGLEVADLHLDTAGADDTSELLAALEQITARLGSLSVLDGLVLAIVPQYAQLPPSDLLLQLTTFAERQSDALRLLLWDPNEELAASWPGAAHFAVDGLWEHLTTLAEAAHKDGPKARELAASPSQRRAMERRLGKRASTRQAASVLSSLLLDAGRLQQEGRLEAAEKKLRTARMLCRMEGLATQQATCSLALGASMCGRDARGALAAFKDARALAESQNQLAIKVQALFGAAAVHLQEHRIADAERTYVQAAQAAEDAELEPLRQQALRMQGACQ